MIRRHGRQGTLGPGPSIRAVTFGPVKAAIANRSPEADDTKEKTAAAAASVPALGAHFLVHGLLPEVIPYCVNTLLNVHPHDCHQSVVGSTSNCLPRLPKVTELIRHASQSEAAVAATAAVTKTRTPPASAIDTRYRDRELDH